MTAATVVVKGKAKGCRAPQELWRSAHLPDSPCQWPLSP